MDFERLLRQHQDAVYRQMIRVCGNHEDAEDALVEAILSAYRASDRLREESAFRGWLATIGRRVCVKLRQRDALLPVLSLSGLVEEGREPTSPSGNPFDAFDRAELKDCVSHALDALPDLYREAYVLREIEGRSAEESSALLGISVPALKSRLHRARALVREALNDGLCATVLTD